MFLQINGGLSLNWRFHNDAVSYSFYIIIHNGIVLNTEIYLHTVDAAET